MSESCDLFLVIPCAIKGGLIFKSPKPSTEWLPEVINDYEEIAKIVLTDQFATCISRNFLSVGNMHFLKQNKLDDEKIVYPISGAINSQWSPPKTSMTLLQDQVYFCTLTLIFRDIELKHIVSMLNSVTSGLLDVNADKVTKNLNYLRLASAVAPQYLQLFTDCYCCGMFKNELPDNGQSRMSQTGRHLTDCHH
jgi:hypothetical protein